MGELKIPEQSLIFGIALLCLEGTHNGSGLCSAWTFHPLLRKILEGVGSIMMQTVTRQH